MKFQKMIMPLVVVIALTMLAVPGLFAQEKMTMEEYNAELANWQKREAEAKAAIKVVEVEIAALKEEIAKVEEEDTKVWQEIYAMLGTDEAGVREYMSTLDNLESEVDGLSNLSPDDLYKRRKEIDELQAKLAELKDSKISALTEAQDKIAVIEGKIAQLRATLDAARKWDEYVVVKGDYLWKIAKKDDIYGDPYQWIRIYTKNREMIKDPNLIYPDWNLKIQRRLEDNEYLVAKGDYLKLIAGKAEVLGDPTKWTEIYEANKDVISKCNGTEESKMLYPYQILVIPGK
jgi:nucleoid-associated protein YgaU